MSAKNRDCLGEQNPVRPQCLNAQSAREDQWDARNEHRPLEYETASGTSPDDVLHIPISVVVESGTQLSTFVHDDQIEQRHGHEHESQHGFGLSRATGPRWAWVGLVVAYLGARQYYAINCSDTSSSQISS